MNLKLRAKQAAFVGLGLFAGSAMAEDSTTKTAINAAIDAGKENYSLVVAGVIAIAAVGVAVGLVLGMMRKS